MMILLLLTLGLLTAEAAIYNIGTPVLQEIWVDPANGSDTNTGVTQAQALRSLTAAWNRIPARQTLTVTGYRIRLAPGTHTQVPIYWESRWGTANFPVIIEASGPGVVLPALNIFDCRYLYLIGFRSTAGAGDVVHCERCDHVLLRNLDIVGTGNPRTYNSPQEALKINQSQHVYIENSDISGAYDNAVDFVAVQYGHLVNNRIHNALDWCAYVKGGSAQITLEGNEIYDCGTGGFTAGQGTGFEFMTPPWLHYEAYDVKFINNIVHDTTGAGFGVNGGYNILLAHNTLTRIGTASHVLEFTFGSHSCDGNTSQCAANRAAGGWGPPATNAEEPIPNRNVYVYNNLIFNPTGTQSRWQQLTIPGPRTPSGGSNIPNPARADTNLLLRGNLIWNGPASLPLGTEGSPLTAQLVADNSINVSQPQLTSDYRLSNQPAARAYDIPSFPGGDQPAGVPSGDLINRVPTDRSGRTRTLNTIGAFEAATTTVQQTLSATPAALRFVFAIGGSTPAAVPLNISADTAITLQPSPSTPWLALTPGTVTTPATVQVSVNPSGLAAGVYQAKVTLNTLEVPVTLVVFTPGSTSQIYGDVPSNHTWIDYIYLLNRFGVTVGCRESPPAYCPADTVTQAQMAAFVIRAMLGETFTYPTTPYFTDLPATNSLFKYVQKMRELNINTGCGGGLFCPNAIVTRGQMATYLARALFGETFPYPTTQRFNDIAPTSGVFKYAQKIWDLGVTQGCTANNYCPDDPVNREQMSAFLSRSFFAYAKLTPTTPVAATGPTIADCPVFPANNVWNTAVTNLPVHTLSSTWVNTIGASRTFHADFGAGLYEGGPIGIPFIIVPENQARVNVSFEYDDESDPGPYPIPPGAPIEGGSSSTGDRHILMVQQGSCVLWETFSSYPQPNGTWQAGSGAIYDLKTNGPLRPAGWTSADAAGLPIFPGLVRYDEVAAGEIKHAIRFTIRQTRREYIWPARHYAASRTGAEFPPMGARFRLKASKNITTFHPHVQVILKAMQKYGIILADNGSDWFISGAPDDRWNNDVLRQIAQLTGSDFEAVDTSGMVINVNSGEAVQPD